MASRTNLALNALEFGLRRAFIDPANQANADRLRADQEGDLSGELQAFQDFGRTSRDISRITNAQTVASGRFFGDQQSGARFRNAFSGVQQGLQDAPGQFNQGAAGINQEFGQGASRLNQMFGVGAAGINQGFAARTQQGLGILEGQGQQTRRDINQRFNNQSARQQADLQSRGLGGNDILSSISSGFERERGDELRRHDEGLAAQRFNAFSGLSADALNTRSQLLGAQTGLGQGLLGTGTGQQAGLLTAGANVNLNSLGQQGNIAQFDVNNATNNFNQNFQNQLLGFVPIQTRQEALRLRGQALGDVNRTAAPPVF